MSTVRGMFARIRGFILRKDAGDDAHEEMQAHLEMEIEEYVRRGMSPAAARRKALLASGGLLQAADAVRDQRGLPWLESTLADVRYAFRALRLSPVFTGAVVLTLALGIGANTAIFTVVHGVLLKPLPHHEGERLVYLRHSADGPTGASLQFSVPEVRDLRNGAPSLGGIAEYSSWTGVYQMEDGAVRIDVGLVTGNYFEVMGLSPVLGRVTQPEDDGPGVAPVAVLSYEAWRNRFGGDSAIAGTVIRLDGKPVTVIGVLQPAPFYPRRVEALLNMAFSEHHLSATMVEGRTHRMTEVVARLAPGAMLDDARAEVSAVLERMQREDASAYDAAAHHRISVLPFRDALGERARLTLYLLMGAAAIVLVIAVASVANLSLMRGVRREHELVVRAALGAGVTRLRRLLLVENVLLALLGAGLGVVIARGGLQLLVSFAERYSPRASEIGLEAPVFAFMLGLTFLVALVLSAVVALPREGMLASKIMVGTRRVAGSMQRHRLQRALVVLQVAVSVVLLAGAGLLTRTMLQLANVGTGLGTEEVLAIQVPLLTPTQIMFDPSADASAKERYAQMLAEIAALPGVTATGVGSSGPLRSSLVRFDVKAENRPLTAGQATPAADLRTADPTFFHAAGIPLLRGRAFASTDRPGGARVVIINQTLADVLFPNEDPIGRRIAWTGEILRFTPISTEWRTVVGVVANTQDGGLDAAPRGAVYSPFAQELALGGTLVIRADANVGALVPAATRIVRRLAPSAPIERVQTIAQTKDESISPRRLNAALITSFGILAVVIAAVGIAGVLGFSVSARTNEIGIRMSLGANSARVQQMILGEGATLLGIGLLLGIATAAFAARVIRGLLFGVTPHDPATFAAVAVTMTLIGLGACWIPARRAARIDPAITMRAE